MSAEERKPLVSRSDKAMTVVPVVVSEPTVPRRNSSTSRFHVTPSSSNVAALDEHFSPNELDLGNQLNLRKGSAPAGVLRVEDSNIIQSESSPEIPTINSPDSQRAVQFDVGDEVESPNRTENTITANLKSWRHMQTIDHPPVMDFYRNSTDAEGSVAQRPSMLELLHGGKQQTEFDEFQEENVQIVDQQIESSMIPEGKGKGKESSVTAPTLSIGPSPVKISMNTPTTPRKKFGWIEGVFFRCVLNIFGVILYLRVSWVAGTSGILFGNAVVLLASLVTTITTLSTCAICTNGDVKGGGAYFLISRSLGPNFGGAIGCIFSIANAVAAAMYVVGFAETVRDLLKERDIVIIDGGLNDVRIVGLVTCSILFCIVLIGTNFESKMQIGLLIILLISILDYFVGSFIPPNEFQQRRGITGYSFNTMKQNLLPEFRNGLNFFEVFAIYFPAATGIMAGANISGDLANPQKSIPKGTLISIAFTTAVYIALITATGSTCLRDADGIHLPTLLTQLWNTTVDSTPPNIPKALFASYYEPACAANNTCPYGLLNYFQVIETGSLWGPLITAGIFAASLSSALASLVSAPKIFQAVAKDGLFPGIGYFAKGFGKDEEPRRAYFLAFFVSMLIILIGDLNVIAPYISNFFLSSYALINFACFDNDFAHSPGWRPGFRAYNMWVSLIGAFLCILIMFITSWFTALMTITFFLALFFYLAHRKPDVNWGDTTQAHSYRTALHGVTRLENTTEHIKNYRPNILLLTGNPAARPSLVDFISNICQNNSLMICSYVLPFEPSEKVFGMIVKLNEQFRGWLRKRRIKSFYVSIANTSLRAGVQALIQCTGLGRLKPNILAMGYKDWTTSDRASLLEYFGIIQDAFDRNLGVMILRANSGGLDFSDLMKTHGVGDTKKLKLPEMTLRPNHSERSLSLTRAAAAAAEAPSSKALEMTDSGVMNLVVKNGNPATEMRIQDNASVASSISRCLDSAHGSFNGSHTDRPDLDDEETESNDEDVEEEPDETQTLNPDDDVEKRRVNFGFYEKNGDEEAAKLQEKRKPMSRRSSRRMTAAQRDLLSSINRFQRKIKKGVIDVYWLYDDGGLTLLVPYLLTQQRSYLEGAKLRVFTISTSSSGLELEHRNMVTLLSKFRISFSDITIIPDAGKKPRKETIENFNHLIEPFRDDGVGMISDADLTAQHERTMRQLRISELLRENSSDADLIVLSLPIPRKGITHPALYMAWLGFMTSDLPPTLLIRGNQTSVLTFYS
ncbi:Amino acid permease-associated region domain containing protein [Aphelenchoides besseyi]|nr:Amino acid permease-associated region domain containing protein [Aphelenchoides besseyi]